MAYAHQQGVIHRDLKPANVLIGVFGEAVVIDWGLAKVIGSSEPDVEGPSVDSAASLTRVGSVMGTPDFMAPEQARGEALDPRCDVYSLGAILWQVLTGKTPYPGPGVADVLNALVRGPPPEADWSGVPSDLVAIVKKAMAYNPNDRYLSAKGLVRDLRRFQAGQLVVAHRYSPGELLSRWARRNRALLSVVAVALIALGVLGAVSLRRILDATEAAQREKRAAVAARDHAQDLQAHAELERQRSVLESSTGGGRRGSHPHAPAPQATLTRSPRLGAGPPPGAASAERRGRAVVDSSSPTSRPFASSTMTPG